MTRAAAARSQVPPRYLWPAVGVVVLALHALTSAARPAPQPAPA